MNSYLQNIQVTSKIHHKALSYNVRKYNGNNKLKKFGSRQQFIAMTFAQLMCRDGLRDIADCLNRQPEALHHLGLNGPLAKSTLANANESRDWRIWQGVAMSLIRKARKLYAGEELAIDLDHTVYALDSSTVDLSLTLFPWATFRKTKAGIKMHTQIDLRGAIPTCIHVTDARQHDINWLDSLTYEPGAIYLADRAYLDFYRLARLHESAGFFVLRSQDNTVVNRQNSRPVNKGNGIRSDQTVLLGRSESQEAFPLLLRRLTYRDPEDAHFYELLTNLMNQPAENIQELYRMRWQIVLFFR